jgi:hypothetical protein
MIETTRASQACPDHVDQLAARGVVRRERGHAERGGDVKATRLEAVALDRLADRLGEARGAVWLDVGQDDGQPVVAAASHHVDLARALADEVGHLSQHLLAGWSAVRGVGWLEAIHLEHYQRQ